MTTAEATADQVPQTEDTAEAENSPASRLLDHAYDDIREYDNPLPGWWSSIFIGSIIFAGFYGLYFHVVGWGATPEDTYRAQLTSYDSKRDLRERAELANVSEDFLAQQVADGKVLARGKAVFAERCASCHGPEGAGVIGPNLTDEFQKHGATRLDLYKTVRGGLPGTAMLAWGEQLPAADIVASTAFVATLRGTNVRGKPPEGARVKPFAK
jgi:cytochrome c oxidase cbb3-type subunit 3